MKVFLYIAASLLLMTSGAFAQSNAQPSSAGTAKPRSRSPIEATPKNGPRAPRTPTAPTAFPSFRPKPTKEPFVRPPKKPSSSATTPTVIFPINTPTIEIVTTEPSAFVATSAPSVVASSAPSDEVATSAPSVVVPTSAPSTATVTTAPFIAEESEPLSPSFADDETSSPPNDISVQMAVETSPRRPNLSLTKKRSASKTPSTVKAPSRPRSPSRPSSPRSGPTKADSRTAPKSPIVKSPAAAGRKLKTVAPTISTV